MKKEEKEEHMGEVSLKSFQESYTCLMCLTLWKGLFFFLTQTITPKGNQTVTEKLLTFCSLHLSLSYP